MLGLKDAFHSLRLSENSKKYYGILPATVRIKRLLELISSYSFNLYYIKGKDMVLIDILSRQNNDSNPHEIIPISFNMHKVLHKNYYNMENY